MTVSLSVASQVGDDLSHLMKTMGAMRHHLPRPHPEVELSAYPIVFTVSNGPVRVSTIAERIHSDVSTVSRQVSHLVQLGLLEKVPDPSDGRAHNVALAPEGKQLLEDLRERRGEMFRSVMSDWSHADARTLHQLLGRLHDDLCTTLTSAPCGATTTSKNRKESM